MHKSTLVNLEQVKEYIRSDGGELIMSNGNMLGVSRRRKNEFPERTKRLFRY